jgi:chromosome segregation ATPase
MSPPAETESHHRRRYVFLGLTLLIIVVVAYFGPVLRNREPDFYDPARTALINARQRFEESLVHEQELRNHMQMAHRQLQSALDELSRVEALDPAHRAGIESLRARLQAIENPQDPGAASPGELQQSYRDLLTQMDALIEDMDSHAQ